MTNDWDMAEEAERVEDLRSKYQLLRSQVKKEKLELQEAEVNLSHALTAQDILQRLAQTIQQKVHSKISEVVSSCLSAVFDDPYRFQIIFDRKRGRTEARLEFTRRGLVVDPLTASGGGVVDVAAFALRIACLALHRPRLRQIVVLDEPFRFVSEEYQKNVRGMLEQLAEDMEVQIIMVTHQSVYEIGKVIELE